MAGQGHGSIIELDIRAQELARRLVYREKIGVAARAMGITIRMARVITRKPEFKLILDALQKHLYEDLDLRAKTEMADVQFKARQTSGEAIDTIITLMRASPSENMKRDCANDIIGYAGVSKSKDKAPTLFLQAQQFNLLLTAIKETDGNGHDGTP